MKEFHSYFYTATYVKCLRLDDSKISVLANIIIIVCYDSPVLKKAFVLCFKLLIYTHRMFL